MTSINAQFFLLIPKFKATAYLFVFVCIPQFSQQGLAKKNKGHLTEHGRIFLNTAFCFMTA